MSGPGRPARRGAGSQPARAVSRHGDARHRRREGRGVTGLACGDGEGQRPCSAVGGQVCLGVQLAAGASKCAIGRLAGARRLFLRAPAACWWARMPVESTGVVQSMSSSASAGARTAAGVLSPSGGVVRRANAPTVDRAFRPRSITTKRSKKNSEGRFNYGQGAAAAGLRAAEPLAPAGPCGGKWHAVSSS